LTEFEALIPDKGLSELQLKYRAVFMSEIGREVLSDILMQCHFGVTLDPDNKVQVAEYNVGMVLLERCGIFRHNTRRDVIGALCSITPATDE